MRDVQRAAELYRAATADPTTALPELRRSVTDPDELVRHVAGVQLALHHPADLPRSATRDLLSTLLRVSRASDESSLTRGPGLDEQTAMPGRSRLVYIAGHRTTYLAPFSHINDIVPGSVIRLEMPYATFVYRAYDHLIVPATDLAMLNPVGHELLRLQACHPRFFATHRYIVQAHLVSERPRGASALVVATESGTGSRS